ncbi:hypothetical protein BCR36DRAFT_325319 [Piromyces finnis]|uniref:C2H2-type domain-containing protein n=1 Tax=Piromyces finnis TaxID=1754191 RepID=A0A1Y1VBF6_9FUNG|nr:hypothetical protein BCR36DRAFT_325319 [Piromyces finnis]|eukprot:ORX51804.1 hypothetical protein BCR36DRAFT_325319 [Piromyces finnis]
MEVYKSKMKKGSKDNMEGTVIVDGEVIKYKEYIVENKDQSGNKSGIKYKHKRIIRRYFCSKEGCRKSFTTSGHVIRHIHSCHLALRPFICKYPGCRSRFGRQDNLRQHYKVHFRKYPKIKFNYREVLTQKQIRELNISPEIMNVNNDELYQYRKSNKEKSDDNMDDNEKHNMVYQKMDHNQETCVLDQPIPSSFQNTKSEIVADDYRTDYSNTLYDDQTSYETPFSSTIYDDQASYSSTTYDDQISSSFVIEDEYKNLTSDLVVLPGTELVPTANESDIIDLEQKTLSKEKHFSLPEESSKRKEKTKTSTEDHPENDQEEGDTSSNPSNSVKMKIKMKNKMNKAPTFKNKQNHNTEIEMNWKLKNPMVDTNLNLTTENNTKDSQMDKDTSFPTSYASEYDVQYTLELDRSHPSMNNIPSTSQLTSLPIKMDNPKVGTLDPNNSNVLNISNVPAIMPSPFLKKVEPTSVISQQLFTSPSLNALNSLSLSNITNPNEHGTKASTLNKSDDESITIPGKITTLTPLSTTANTMISNNPSNRLMSSNNSFSISSLDSHSMVRPTPTVNRSNSLPNPQHTPIVALSSTSSNTTSSDYLDIIQLPPPMLSQDPDQRVNPSLPPPISISKNYFITHPSQASSPTTTLYGQNVLYQTIPTPLSSNPQQNVQVPFPSLDYSSSYDNTSSTSTTPSSSKVYLSNTSYHSVNPENTFQNTNPWLLEFQPITTPAYQNYPNYHLNSIENSDMEIMKKRLHTTTATQNIDSFYYI